MIFRTAYRRNATRQRLRRTWHALIGELHDPDVELTLEEFAALLSTYKRLASAGHRFDPAVVALMACLERQASETIEAVEDDTDGDADNDDPDEDACSYTR